MSWVESTRHNKRVTAPVIFPTSGSPNQSYGHGVGETLHVIFYWPIKPTSPPVAPPLEPRGLKGCSMAQETDV